MSELPQFPDGKSGTTAFRWLNDTEWEQWNDRRFQAALALMGNNQDDTDKNLGDSVPSTSAAAGEPSSSTTSSTADTAMSQSDIHHHEITERPSGSRKRKAVALQDSVVVNTLTSVSCSPIEVIKKP